MSFTNELSGQRGCFVRIITTVWKQRCSLLELIYTELPQINAIYDKKCSNRLYRWQK
uniref:Uncharacterized protein n=1 Tax=Arundo donax TaxID=35708 RepID=A0A0A9BCU7_ARUDO